MKDMGTSLLFAALILVLSCSPAWAQATAQINGTVKDQTGALLPGVQVTATQTATGFARSAVTNEVGLYTLTELPSVPTSWKRPFRASGLLCKPESCCRSGALQ